MTKEPLAFPCANEIPAIALDHNGVVRLGRHVLDVGKSGEA